jgi:hypothetical protein
MVLEKLETHMKTETRFLSPTLYKNQLKNRDLNARLETTRGKHFMV